MRLEGQRLGHERHTPRASGVRGLVLEPRSFAPRRSPDAQARLEAGRIVVPDAARFDLPKAAGLLFGAFPEGAAKSVSFNSASGVVKGAGPDVAGPVGELLTLYGDWAERLVGSLAPAYAGRLIRGKATFRPRPAEAPVSAHKDDRRLHVDAFPSQPARGRRILRVFHNIDPEGRDRVWATGEPFEEFAARFIGRVRPPLPGASLALARLGLTKGRRAPYDWLMLGLHDAAKADDAYQASGVRQILRFPPETTWLVFSDATVHAAVSGRFALEQTFLLPIEAMADPDASPLRVLERMTGRRLA